MDFSEVFEKALRANGMEKYLPFTDRFARLADLLRETNGKFNLTAITDDEGIAYKHFADCLAVEKYIPEGAKVLDVGAGGGFPTLPLAIVRRDIRISALDSTAKKLSFIEDAAKAFGLSNITTVNMRAEDAGRCGMRESYDFITSRAVARLNILCEWCVPLLRVGGTFAALKGSAAQEEADEAKSAVKTLGCTQRCDRYTFYSPEEVSRGIIVIRKEKTTDKKYPRNNAQIKKKPL